MLLSAHVIHDITSSSNVTCSQNVKSYSNSAVRYIAKLEDGNVFERKGFDGGQPLEFITAEGEYTLNDFSSLLGLVELHVIEK